MTTTQTRPIRGQCRKLLAAFHLFGWRAEAYKLNRLGMLNERARISDLRHRFGLRIDAESERFMGQTHTVYTLHEDSIPHAEELLAGGGQ